MLLSLHEYLENGYRFRRPWYWNSWHYQQTPGCLYFHWSNRSVEHWDKVSTVCWILISIEHCGTGFSVSWYWYCDKMAFSMLRNVFISDFTNSKLGPSNNQQNPCAARKYVPIIPLSCTLTLTNVQQWMGLTLQATRLPTQMNGANSFTYLGRNFTTSTEFGMRSYKIQRPRQERMQAYPLYPSISASTLQMSLHSLLPIFLDWQRSLWGTNHGILKADLRYVAQVYL